MTYEQFDSYVEETLLAGTPVGKYVSSKENGVVLARHSRTGKPGAWMETHYLFWENGPVCHEYKENEFARGLAAVALFEEAAELDVIRDKTIADL